MDALRVGRRVVASLPNFGHWKARWQLLTTGRAPVTSSLPYQWYDTPNVHSLTIKDFRIFLREQSIRIVQGVLRGGEGARGLLAQSAGRQRRLRAGGHDPARRGEVAADGPRGRLASRSGARRHARAGGLASRGAERASGALQ